jgi:hypothetical protein
MTSSRALLEACPNPEILVNNSAGPAPKMFADVEPGEWPQAVARWLDGGDESGLARCRQG